MVYIILMVGVLILVWAYKHNNVHEGLHGFYMNLMLASMLVGIVGCVGFYLGKLL